MASEIPWSQSVDYSGIVGAEFDESITAPIVFVHGNGRNATDWVKHFSYFSQKGVNPSRLFAISFDNSNMTHDSLASQLEDFVTQLFELTDAESISFVGHSLGVTVGRVWLEQYDRYANVDVFVGLAGANHGLDLCGLCKVSERLPVHNRFKPCQTLGSSVFYTPPIEKLNEQVGETPGDIKYYTIRGMKDKLFAGCMESPELEGAVENVALKTGHDGVREDMEAIERVYAWVIDNNQS